jgi:tRNA(fMet)-specific endonuclease VapC
VNPALIDTDTISFFLRGDTRVTQHAGEYLKEHGILNLSIITYYEILSGLKYKDARQQLDSFLQLAESSKILPATENAMEIAADIYADLRKDGQLIDDIDIIIAGIALSNNLVLVTHNRSHFDRIDGLKIEDWLAD